MLLIAPLCFAKTENDEAKLCCRYDTRVREALEKVEAQHPISLARLDLTSTPTAVGP
jgi:hypothetical protein